MVTIVIIKNIREVTLVLDSCQSLQLHILMHFCIHESLFDWNCINIHTSSVASTAFFETSYRKLSYNSPSYFTGL